MIPACARRDKLVFLMAVPPRRASLRRKTLLLVGATTLGLVAALYVPLRALLLGSFRELEDDEAAQNLDRAANAIDTQRAQVEATCRDYAVWDDTFAFLGGEDPEYPRTNFPRETYDHNRLAMIVLLDTSGAVRFGGAYDRERRAEVAVPDLAPALERLCPRGRCAARSGLIETPFGPMLIAAHPVLPSDGSGTARGAMIMGRELDDAQIAELGEATDLALSIVRSDDARPMLTEVLDEERLAVHAPLADVTGAPYLRLRVEMARDVYARGVLGTRVLAVAVAIAGLVFGVLILLLLDRVVLRRVGRLSQDVERVSSSADPSQRVAVQGEDELAGLATSINGMLGELAAAREVIRSAFGRYVSEDVARAILAQPEGPVLGGQVREVTILFSDIRGYSTISERMAPADVVDLLNEYFGAMSAVIESEGGVVIEFLGDAILAVFGAPGDLDEHAERAVRAALAIERRGEELNRAWDASGRSGLWRDHGIEALRSRIGIHTGRVVAGNLGSRTRMKYAVIGDAVNTAARVEGLNDVVGTSVLLTAQVREQLSDALAERTQDRGEHAVKGRERPVHVFTILSDA